MLEQLALKQLVLEQLASEQLVYELFVSELFVSEPFFSEQQRGAHYFVEPIYVEMKIFDRSECYRIGKPIHSVNHAMQHYRGVSIRIPNMASNDS